MVATRTRTQPSRAGGQGKERNGSAANGTSLAVASSAASTSSEQRGGSPRPLWRGAISFGLVTVPVRLYAATGSKDLAFHLLHDTCNTRLRQLRWCPTCNREVPWDEVVRGYEFSKGEYVRLTDADFESLPVANKHTIDLAAFVLQSDIDPIFYERSYYVEPEATGRKAFALLVRALLDRKLIGVGTVALRERGRLCAVRPREDGLVLETLFYADEIRAMHSTGALDAEINSRELDMAVKLIDLLTEHFQPEKYHDTYRDALVEVIERKAHGGAVVSRPEAPKGEVIDLMEALRKSLEEASLPDYEKVSPAPRSHRKRRAA